MNKLPEAQRERLYKNIAAMQAYLDGKDIQRFNEGGNVWEDITFPTWFVTNMDYREKPKASVRFWSRPEDVPGPVCWLRFEGFYTQYLITTMCTDYVYLGGLKYSWDVTEKCEYSTDRVTWLPCVVKEDGQ